MFGIFRKPPIHAHVDRLMALESGAEFNAALALAEAALENGIDPNARNWKGLTALSVCQMPSTYLEKQQTIISALVKWGANPLLPVRPEGGTTIIESLGHKGGGRADFNAYALARAAAEHPRTPPFVAQDGRNMLHICCRELFEATKDSMSYLSYPYLITHFLAQSSIAFSQMANLKDHQGQTPLETLWAYAAQNLPDKDHAWDKKATWFWETHARLWECQNKAMDKDEQEARVLMLAEQAHAQGFAFTDAPAAELLARIEAQKLDRRTIAAPSTVHSRPRF